jgi:hypothetical protein
VTFLRRMAAALVALALVVLVACDLWIAGFRSWWDRHSLTGSIVANLLVLAVTALIVDEVVARRQRRDRSVTVAVQGLIVYGQARRTHDAIVATNPSRPSAGTAGDELRTLATMLLSASPSLFDDPDARVFLEQVERFSVTMLRAVTTPVGQAIGTEDRDRLATEMTRLKETVQPLLIRIPPEERHLLEGESRA